MGIVYWLGYTLTKLLGKFWLSYRVVGKEKLVGLEGGLLIVSNHVSFLDPPLVGIAFDEGIHYFARKTLFDSPIANFLFTRCNAIPVNQDKPEVSSLKRVIALLRDGEKVVIFPEGERSLDGVMNMTAQPGVGLIVTKADVPILPVRLFGPEKALPRGSKKLEKYPVTLVVGDVIRPENLVGDLSLPTKERYEGIARRVMEEIAKLELPER
jgi:1-acyl-sn-glycerol-3-phosphate acyltransferase